jgi:hypothetical protein
MTTFRKFWETRPRTDYQEYFNDFLRAGDYAATDWTITTTEAGGSSATEAIDTAAAGGVLVITNDTNDNDADFLQSTLEAFDITVGKAFEFEMRFKISDVTNTDFIAGLCITDTTPLANSDGVFIRKNEDDTTPDLVVCKNSTETVVAFPDALVNDTWVKMGFYYDGSGDTVDMFVNDVRVAAAPITNLPDDELLAITFGLANGSAAGHVLSVDYIRAIAER